MAQDTQMRRESQSQKNHTFPNISNELTTGPDRFQATAVRLTALQLTLI